MARTHLLSTLTLLSLALAAQALTVVHSNAQPAQVAPSEASDAEPSVTRLVLVDAKSGKDLFELTDGTVVNLSTLPSRTLTVRAETLGAVQEVAFELNNHKRFRIERAKPYTLAGKKPGRLNGWTPKIGPQRIKVIPFRRWNGKEPGVPREIMFEVIDDRNAASPTAPLPTPTAARETPQRVAHLSRGATHDPYGALAVTGLVLVDAGTREPILNITNGMTLDIGTFEGRILDVVPSTAGDVASIEYQFDRIARYHRADRAPYSLLRPQDRRDGWKPSAGIHTLIATPYSRTRRSGIPLQLSFKVVKGGAPFVSAFGSTSNASRDVLAALVAKAEPEHRDVVPTPPQVPTPSQQKSTVERAPTPEALPKRDAEPHPVAAESDVLSRFEAQTRAETRLLRHRKTAQRMAKVKARQNLQRAESEVAQILQEVR